ncbi:MAG: PilZ domain-containing protein [Methylococcaceae bacterium]|nr:MAG: PilZ domain-containing protein [Methylococcaceae bacterium]
MPNHPEKRKFRRTGAHCRLHYRPVSGEQAHDGHCLNLSGNGLLFFGPVAVTVGQGLEVMVEPEAGEQRLADFQLTPSLDAYAEATRCEPYGDGFEIAATITGIKGA